MMSFAGTESIVSFTLLLCAFIFSITLSGTVQAYVARWCDDYVADQLGYTEFNPFLFINLLDFVWFFAFEIMIGRPVPLHLGGGINRYQSWWRLRTFLLFASRPLCNILITIVALLLGTVLCKSIFMDLLAGSAVHQNFTVPHLLCLFCGSLIRANIFLATFESCRQIMHFFVLYKMEKDYNFIEYADYILALGPIMVWLFFHKTIARTLVYVVDCVVLGISKLCGIG